MQATATPRPAPAELDDVTLRRAIRGDAGAFRALVDRYGPPVHALLWRMLEHAVGGARVDELVQDTFVRVHGALSRFDPDGPARLSTWIFTVATRLALNEKRRARPLTTAVDGVVDEAVERPDQALERRRRAAAVRAAIAVLDPPMRAALVLREYHDLDYAEIARVLEIEPGTVKSRISRARAAVRRALEAADVRA